MQARSAGRRVRTWNGDGEEPAALARVERFAEPALLLHLRGGAAHGYELASALAEWRVDARADMGNLYRLLRHLEDAGIVASDWSDAGRGPARRTYRLTPRGDGLLESWLGALAGLRTTIDAFLERAHVGADPARTD